MGRTPQRASIEIPSVPWHFTFIPSSHEIQRSPLVKKQATACLARWWIQPSSRSWVIIASIHGKPVWPWENVNLQFHAGGSPFDITQSRTQKSDIAMRMTFLLREYAGESKSWGFSRNHREMRIFRLSTYFFPQLAPSSGKSSEERVRWTWCTNTRTGPLIPTECPIV